jgi:MFS family permease
MDDDSNFSKSTLDVPSNYSRIVPLKDLKTESFFDPYRQSFIHTFSKKSSILLTLNASLSLFFTGYMVGVMNTMHETFIQIFNWNEEDSKFFLSIFSSMPIITGVIGSICAFYIINSFGRKNSFLICNFISIVGMLLTVFYNPYLIIAGRMLIGFSAGIYEVLTPVYINEYVPYELSGLCGGIYESFNMFGILISHILGFWLPTNYHNNTYYWQFMFLFPIITVILNTILTAFIFKYDTPKFLYLNRNNEAQCRKALKIIYKNNEYDINKMVSDYSKLKESLNNEELSFSALFSKRFLLRLMIGVAINIAYQTCGISTLIIYSNDIFKDHRSGFQTTLFTNLISIHQFIAGFLAIFLIHNLGRRGLLVYGILAQAIIMAIVAFLYLMNISHSFSDYLLLLFSFINGATLSPLSIIYTSDILPDKGVSLCMVIHIIAEIIVVESFLYIKSHGLHMVFFYYATITFGFFMFCYKYVKETKNLSHYKIEKLF